MRVVTWNVQFGIETELAASEILTTPALSALDVLLLQEMDEPGTATIAESIGATYAYTSAAPHERTGRDFGNAVLSRWPLRGATEISLPHVSPVNGQPRSATRATVEIDGRDVAVYSVHTEVPTLRLAKRVEQFDAVADDVRRAGASLVVVGGDFNTVTGRGVRALADRMSSAGLERLSSPNEASYIGRGQRLVLDHIFGSGFDVVDRGVVRGTASSDHDPLWVELDASGEPPRRATSH